MIVKDTDGYRRSRKGEEVYRPVWNWEGIPIHFCRGEWRTEPELLAFIAYCPNMAFIETMVT